MRGVGRRQLFLHQRHVPRVLGQYVREVLQAVPLLPKQPTHRLHPQKTSENNDGDAAA